MATQRSLQRQSLPMVFLPTTKLLKSLLLARQQSLARILLLMMRSSLSPLGQKHHLQKMRLPRWSCRHLTSKANLCASHNMCSTFIRGASGCMFISGLARCGSCFYLFSSYTSIFGSVHLAELHIHWRCFLFLRPRPRLGALCCCALRIWICTVYPQSLVWRLGLAEGAVARQEPVS